MTPAELRTAGEQLDAVAGVLADRAETFGGARETIEGDVDTIPEVWESPLAETVHARTSGVTGALTAAPEPLTQAADELRELATSAQQYADSIQADNQAATAADQAVTDASHELEQAGTAGQPVNHLLRRIDAQSMAAQQARERAEQTVADWRAAESRAAATVDECDEALRGHLVDAVSFDPVSAGAYASGNHGMATDVQNLLLGTPDIEDGHPSTELQEFLDSLGPGPLSPEEYQEAAREFARSLLPDGQENDRFAQNRAITQAYAQMYFLDPDTYKWAGMAAFASDTVGDGMRQADAARQTTIPWIPGVTDFSFTELGDLLYEGNAMVYEDLFWQHLAYEHGGMDAIDRAWDEGEMPFDAYQGWGSIDRGRTSGDTDLLWQGNRDLLYYEQRVTLQDGVYDEDRKIFQRISSRVVGWAMPMESPIPGDDTSFQDMGSGDLGDFDDRWRWIDESILPAWQDSEWQLQDELTDLAQP